MFLLVITYYSLDEIWRLQTNELTFSLICAITLGLTYLAHEYMRIIVNHSQPNLTTTTLKDTTEKSIEIVLVIELAAAVGGSLFAAYKSNEKKKERDNKKTPILDEINARRQQQLAKQDALNKFIEDKLDKRSEENTISIGKGLYDEFNRRRSQFGVIKRVSDVANVAKTEGDKIRRRGVPPFRIGKAMLNHTAGGKSDDYDSESREDAANSEEEAYDYEAGYELDSDAEDVTPETILGKINQMKNESAQLQTELTETKTKMTELEKENQELKERTEQCKSASAS
tara:strand:+ start:179 stop:1033 length:855 start_codon:yes stop_codon:yes gene_type:complete